MKRTFYGAVISALACIVCGVGLYKTYEPICIVFGALAVMAFIGCISDLIEKEVSHE